MHDLSKINNSPIVESVIGVMVKFETIDYKIISNFIENQLKQHFLNNSQKISSNVPIQDNNITIFDENMDYTKYITGIRIGIENDSIFFFIQNSGISVSIVGSKKYQNWDYLYNIFAPVYHLYIQVLNPMFISRIGTRYINDIYINEINPNYSDYFTIYPKMYDDEYCCNFEINSSRTIQNKYMAIIKQLKVPAINLDVSRIIIDIDVYLACNMEISYDIKDELYTMRSIKNDIFNKSITDKTIKLFL